MSLIVHSVKVYKITKNYMFHRVSWRGRPARNVVRNTIIKVANRLERIHEIKTNKSF